jgi:hypothetical protein
MANERSVIPGFVMGADSDQNTTQKVLGIIPVDSYLVQFKDSEGREAVRMVFQPKGTKVVFNMQEKIAGMHVATEASGWFKDSFNQALAKTQDVKTI